MFSRHNCLQPSPPRCHDDASKLWEMAADAKWGNGKCVSGSTCHKSAVSVESGEPFNKKQGNATDTNEFTGAAGSVSVGMLTTLIASFASALLLL